MGTIDWIALAQNRGQVENSCKCGNETSGSIKCTEVLQWLNWWPLEQ
jgi:hypothetical protein